MAVPNTSAHVVLLPSPGIGHLIPFVELAKRLVNHNLTVTLITFSDLSTHVQQSLLSSLPVGISSVSLPPIPLHDLPADAHIVTRLSHMVARSTPFLRLILLNLRKYNTRIVAYIIDLFGGDTLCVATELSIPRYVFFTSNFFYLSFFRNLPNLYRESNDDKMLSLPGCVQLHAKDFSRSASNKKSEEFGWMVRHAKHVDQVDGIMVNSFEAVEGDVVKCLKECGNGKHAIIPIGPLTSKVELESEVDCCYYMDWLDQQPDRSVLFISLGSGGTLSMDQTREMALGLEMSGQRFIWIVRAPVLSDTSANYFGTQGGKNNPLDFLPQGFVDRTKGTGMFAHTWAPQAKILAHEAIGGFLSHCGWNSALESMVNGVPMIAWPLYSEQPMNAVMLVEGLKVALRPTPKNEMLVNRDEIAEVVNRLMERDEGKEVRRRMHEVKRAAAMAVEGASYLALTSMVDIWKASSNSTLLV